MVGLTGLASDVLTLDHTLKMHCNLYKLRENREIKPETFSALLSTLLYEKRYPMKEAIPHLNSKFSPRSFSYSIYNMFYFHAYVGLIFIQFYRYS